MANMRSKVLEYERNLFGINRNVRDTRIVTGAKKMATIHAVGGIPMRRLLDLHHRWVVRTSPKYLKTTKEHR